MNEYQYLAISIGPIYATLQRARRTRELWVTSYLFSRLMELLYDQIESVASEILAPFPPTQKPKGLYGAGVYPDRLFAIIPDVSDEKISGIIKEAIKALTAECLTPVRKNEIAEAIDFWEGYLRVEYLIFPSDLEGGSLLLELNDRLDTLELQPTYFEEEPKVNYLTVLLNDPYEAKIWDHLKSSGGSYRFLNGDNLFQRSIFPSTGILGTFELHEKDAEGFRKLYSKAREEALKEDVKEDDQTLELLYQKLEKKQDNPFHSSVQPYHKYFCIVHADGDSFGKTLNSLTNNEAVKKFSEKLAGFAEQAADTINHFGGKPVYIGGDDLVFLAPVRSAVGTVFDCIQKLIAGFNAIPDLDPRPTLSFGVTITYYKYPLFEARDLSYGQLADRAKNFVRSNGKEKSAIGFRLLKHSLAYFEGIISGQHEQFEYLTGFTRTTESLPEAFLSSVMFKVDTLKPLFETLAKEQDLTIEKLDALFENYFNEPIHRTYQRQLGMVKQLILAVFSDQPSIKADGVLIPVNRMENLYATLRILDFISPKIQPVYESVE
ncbi:MAG TPA: type III-B CRISPR-associated protein Cas10/Cmr2 [Flavilitoribacter sp.]|nr:type III-B CRISPR-associated protein Cas10/Cmr2 [Flavilitoribacter sp.]